LPEEGLEGSQSCLQTALHGAANIWEGLWHGGKQTTESRGEDWMISSRTFPKSGK